MLGFIIDDSLGMQHFPSDAYSEDAGDVSEMFEKFVQGSYGVAGMHWPVMSLQHFLMTQDLENWLSRTRAV